MWHALKAELIYFRPWLLGGLGIAAFVSTLLTVLARVVDGADGVPGFLAGMFPIIAGMVVAFIAQSYRSEEHRARLLMAGPMVPRQLAGVMVLLPICLVGLGALAGGLFVGAIALLTGPLEAATLPTLGVFAVQFLAYAQMGPLAQEATAARNQRRSRAAVAGWTVFVGAVMFLVASQFILGSAYGVLGQLMTVVAAMVVSAVLYQGRTDFTR
mgnify:FL=1